MLDITKMVAQFCGKGFLGLAADNHAHRVALFSALVAWTQSTELVVLHCDSCDGMEWSEFILVGAISFNVGNLGIVSMEMGTLLHGTRVARLRAEADFGMGWVYVIPGNISSSKCSCCQ